MISFYIPSVLFLYIFGLLLSSGGFNLEVLKVKSADFLKDGLPLAILAFVLAIFLQSLNREFIRLLEGYWSPKGLRRWLTGPQRKIFKELRGKYEYLRRERDEHRINKPSEGFPQDKELQKVALRLANNFPSKENLVLPTSFGNTMRAYEDYPRVIYGFESIQGWSRVQPLMPDKSLELLTRIRAPLDMWVNIFYLSAIVMLGGCFLPFINLQSKPFWFAGMAVVFAIISYRRARSSAERYGEFIKAMFDLYVPELCKKLGYSLSPEPKTNRNFFKAFSQMIVYRNADSLNTMASFGVMQANKEAISK